MTETSTTPTPKKEQSPLAVPIAIVLAGALVAAAIIFSDKTAPAAVAANPAANVPAGPDAAVVKEILKIKPTDHVLGNPNAEIVFFEYSDLECPFCKRFHETMKQVLDRHGKDGKIAFVYRHFPLSIHPRSPKESEAAECVNALGGNDAFWKFTDLVFGEKPIEKRTDPTDGKSKDYLGFTDLKRLPEFAERAGVDRNKFELCNNSGKYDDTIAKDVTEAIAAGGNGTPHTLIVAGNEIKATLPGAIPFENYSGSNGQMQSGLDAILADLVKQIP